MAENITELKFAIKKISEVSFFYELGDLPTDFDIGSIDVELNFDIDTNFKEEIISLKFGVRYLSDQIIDSQNPFAMYRTLFEFKFSEFNSVFIEKNNKKFYEPKMLEKIIQTTISGTRGMLFMKLNGTIPFDFILPILDTNLVVDSMSKEEIKSKKSKKAKKD